MSAISTSLNFTFTVTRPSDGGKWGEEIRPGVFSGITGELQKDYADVIWANLFAIPNRYKYIDYTDPYFIDHICYMVGSN